MDLSQQPCKCRFLFFFVKSRNRLREVTNRTQGRRASKGSRRPLGSDLSTVKAHALSTAACLT